MSHKNQAVKTLTFITIITLIAISFLPAITVKAETTGTWQISGDMLTPRSRHTATLLPNGTVLVTGGYTIHNPPVITSAVEIFDPATNEWSSETSMLEARSRHTGTLLPNGKILVIGGRDNNGFAITSAELYDPITGTWSLTGSMHTPRADHTAILLNDGRVLVTGGQSVGDGLDNPIEKTAETYDPMTGEWTAVEKMSTARFGHTATMLPNGSVLVVGGAGPALDGVYTVRSEIFNPVTNKWRNVDSLNTPRGFHTAILLGNGNVLVAGGFTLPVDPLNRTSSAELYQASSNQWAITGDLNIPHNAGGSGGLLLGDGRAFIVGGRSNIAEIYNPSTGTWVIAGQMSVVRSRHVVTLLSDGRVLITGGENRDGYIATTEIYKP